MKRIMHSELFAVLKTSAWGFGGSLVSGTIYPAEFQSWFQLVGAIGGTLVTILSVINLIWIMAERARNSAESARRAAISAKATADSAKITAESAKITAESAKSIADIAKSRQEDGLT